MIGPSPPSQISLSLAQVLEGHDQAVTAVAFCTRTDRLVSGGDDLTIRVWEFMGKAWKQTALLMGHNSGITDITFHPGASYSQVSTRGLPRMMKAAGGCWAASVALSGHLQEPAASSNPHMVLSAECTRVTEGS